MENVAKEFELDVNYVKDRLQHCFNFDYLFPEQGIAILIGLEPSYHSLKLANNWGIDEETGDIDHGIEFGIKFLNGDEIADFHESFGIEEEYQHLLNQAVRRFTPFVDKFELLNEYWKSGKHPDRTSLPYFIEWALSKNFRPAWLDRAIEFGLYVPPHGAEPTAQSKAIHPTNSDPQPAKWRKAFEYESEGLNALYNLIERHYFDADNNPVYKPAKWPLKKELVSDWLSGRTLGEADTIITSGQRKGKAEK